MQNGAADHGIGKGVGKASRLDRLDAEIRGGQTGRQPLGQDSHAADRFRIRIEGADLEAFPEKVDEIAAPAAARIENAHPRVDAASEQLIEQIDVDRSEEGGEIGHGAEAVASADNAASPAASAAGEALGVRREANYAFRAVLGYGMGMGPGGA